VRVRHSEGEARILDTLESDTDGVHQSETTTGGGGGGGERERERNLGGSEDHFEKFVLLTFE
jgi:hypothetical protein